MRRPNTTQHPTPRLGVAPHPTLSQEQLQHIQQLLDNARQSPSPQHTFDALLKLEQHAQRNQISAHDLHTARRQLTLHINDILTLLRSSHPLEISDIATVFTLPTLTWLQFLLDCLRQYPLQTHLPTPPPQEFFEYIEQHDAWLQNHIPNPQRILSIDRLLQTLVDQPQRIGTIHDYIHYSLLSVFRALRTDFKNPAKLPSLWIELTMPLPTILCMLPSQNGGWEIGEDGLRWMRETLAQRIQDDLEQKIALLRTLSTRQLFLTHNAHWKLTLEDVLY